MGKRNAAVEKSTSTRDALLDAAEEVMQREGYAAVSTRRLAAIAGVKGPVIHYYFDTMDDLFVAVFRRIAEQGLRRLEVALTSEMPLRSIWEHAKLRAPLISEFLALANHRKVIRQEIASYSLRSRNLQTEAAARYLRERGIVAEFPLGAIPAILTSISNLLTMEHILGVSVGFADAETFVELCFRKLERESGDRGDSTKGGSASLLNRS